MAELASAKVKNAINEMIEDIDKSCMREMTVGNDLLAYCSVYFKAHKIIGIFLDCIMLDSVHNAFNIYCIN